MFEIVKTRPGDNNFHKFVSFPREVYPADSLFFKIPESFNEEYLHAGYLLTINGKVLCRAALYHNPHLQYLQKQACCIGNYEALDDRHAAAELIRHIASEAKNLGAAYLIGPMNGSTWDNYRFSVHHDHPNFFLEPYHHLYYTGHFSNSGFEVIGRYYSSLETDLAFNDPAVLQREQELRQAGVNFRNINLDAWESELEKVFAFNATGFKTNFLYTPVSKADFMKKYAETKRFIEPKFVVLAEDAGEALVGYFFCITDFYNQQSKALIAKTVARHPDKKWSGIGHVLGNIICGRAWADGYQSIIHALMYEDGTSNKMSKNFSGRAYKNYVLFAKAV